MKIAIRYFAAYHYEEKASFSPHSIRLFPRQDMSVKTERIQFSTTGDADIQYRQDIFDNHIARCFYPNELDCLKFHLELDVQLTPRNPFHFLLDSHALELPFDYLPEEKNVLAPYLARQADELALPSELSPLSSSMPTVDALVAMNNWLHRNIAYERRDEGDPFAPAETLQRQSGSCRDFAALFVEILRRHRLASRLASGFLWENQTPEADQRAVNALHAWVEVYLPGAGWIGLDPTNGVLCDHHFLVTAVGISPKDISPVAGHYYSKKTIASTMETTLSIIET